MQLLANRFPGLSLEKKDPIREPSGQEDHAGEDFLLPGRHAAAWRAMQSPTEYRAIALGCSGSGLALKGDLSALSETTNMLSHDPIPTPSPIHTAWRTVYVT